MPKHDLKDLERIKQFRLMDYDFMTKCFENNIECTELVLNIILNRNDLKVEKVQTQYLIKNLQGRSSILDIYATDTNGKKYNIEVQRVDKGAAVKRARYISSLIDTNITSSGDEYNDLSETYVIFITENDVFKKDLAVYHIDRIVRETGETFNDEAHIIYVNGATTENSPIGILMHDFRTSNPNEMKYKPLANRTRYFKEDEEGVGSMCKIMEDMRKEVIAEAARAEHARKCENAKTLIKMNKLSLEEVKKINDELCANN